MPSREPDEPPIYEVRLTEPAEAEVESAYLGRMQYGLRIADSWYAGLAQALESLSLFPHRFSLAPESDVLGGNVRQMIYGKGRNAYRILYRVIEPQEDSPGIVCILHVLHVRHAARRHLNQILESEHDLGYR